MKKFFSSKFIMAILCFVLSGYAMAAKVTTKSNFSQKTMYLNLDVRVNNSTEYKAYIKDTTSNINNLSGYGNVYGSPLSLDKVGEYMGQCVSFVKAVTNAKGTTSWYGTEKVSKNKHLPKNTPIATMTRKRPDGKPGYNGYDGKSHVAIYLKHYKNGILVIDQNFYLDGKLNVHYIPFSGSNQNNAGNYYILEQDWKIKPKICDNFKTKMKA